MVKEWGAMEFAVTIGMDALRIAIGIAPRNHDIETICRWLEQMNKRRQGAGK